MKRSMWITGLVALVGLALLFAHGTQVSAQDATAGAVLAVEQWDQDVTIDDATLDDVTLEDETMGLRRGRRLPVPPCLRAAAVVLRACPCAGPLGEDGKPAVDADGNRVPWADHQAYVDCVTARVEALQAKGLGEECAAKLIKRATESKVGEEGFECPTLRQVVKARRIAARVVDAVAKACPCAGPLGEDGKPAKAADGTRVPWDDHAAYVDCVKAKVAELVDKGMAQEVADRIIARAEASKIGDPDFKCPRVGPGARPGVGPRLRR